MFVMRIWIKRIGIFISIPTILAMIVSILLYIPSFQNYAVNRAMYFASEATDMNIRMDRINLSFPIRLHIKGLLVTPDSVPSDTILSLHELNLHIRPWPLLTKDVLVESIGLEKMKINTGGLIDGMEVMGYIESVSAKADRISLSSEKATLNRFEVSDAALTLLITDTTSKADTTQSEPINWLLRLDKIDMNRVALAMQIPQDSLRVSGFVHQAKLRNGEVDLGKSIYRAKSFILSQSSATYDYGNSPTTAGLDMSHIVLSDINIETGRLLYGEDGIGIKIDKFSLKERSGLEVTQFKGEVNGDSTKLNVSGFQLLTPYSSVELEADVPYSAFSKRPHGSFEIHADGKLGKNDVITCAGELPESFIRAYPEEDIDLSFNAAGNLKSLELKLAEIKLPGAFNVLMYGNATSLQNREKRQADFKLEANSGNLDFLLEYLPSDSKENYNIPKHLSLYGNAELNGNLYKTDLVFKDGDGRIALAATYDQKAEKYTSSFAIDSIEPIHFLPNDSLLRVTGLISIDGQGLNPFDSLTYAKLNGNIYDLQYGTSSVSDITMEGTLKDNELLFDLVSHYPLAQMDISLNATLKPNNVKAMLIADMQHLDLHNLNISTVPLSTSFQIFAEAETDMKEKYNTDLTLGNWEMNTSKGVVHPKTLVLRTRTHSDSTYVSFNAGDMFLKLSADLGPIGLSKRMNDITSEMERQFAKDSVIRLSDIRALWPKAHLQLTAKRDNPIYNFLQIHFMSFKELQADAFTSPDTGISMNAYVNNFLRDTFLLDTIKMKIAEDTIGIYYQANIAKRKFKRQAPFFVDLSGRLETGYADALLQMRDAKGNNGFLIGANVKKEKTGGVNIHIFPENPTLFFLPFSLNEDNYIAVRDLKNIDANFNLRGKKGAFLEIKSEKVDRGLNKVNAAVGQIRLNEMARGFSSYLPDVGGMFNADFQYMPSDSSFTLTAGFNIDSLYYDKRRVGDLLFSTVYLPLSQNEHQVDVHFFRDTEEIMLSSLYYQSGTTDSLTGNLSLLDMPLDMLNPFIPEGMAELRGTLVGDIEIDGATESPNIEGYLRMDSADMYVGMANTTVKLDNQDVEIHDKKVWFNKYKLFANGDNPFIINGTIDFNNLSDMKADLKLSAQNMQLLNAKRTKQSLVYGKMFVNLSSTLKGPLASLVMRGDLQLLGGSNFTYVLQDSPLTVQDRLSGLVTFTSFDEDTILSRRPRLAATPLGGMDMLMAIHIDQSVQINADLTPDQSSHVNLEGGGDLSFQYTPQGDMLLNGRYTLTDGTIKYTLPVIPLKEFNIQQGSYVQWTGDMMNPALNITATERVRSSAVLDDQSSRMVNFDVGIQLTQTLENLGLKFILKAPEDASIQEQLARMGEEELSKQAVSMLVTGVYLGGGTATGKSNLNMGTALNSFLQSEINNIAGSALKTIDINIGMESYDEEGDGSKRTDYSFRFAKRFYNDRIRVVLGGRISTGDDINQGQAQPFIDNISVEYRLDRGGTRYVKLFHNKDYESLLEGELTETGAGIVLHKKMERMRELFIFKRARKVKPENDNQEGNNDEK